MPRNRVKHCFKHFFQEGSLVARLNPMSEVNYYLDLTLFFIGLCFRCLSEKSAQSGERVEKVIDDKLEGTEQVVSCKQADAHIISGVMANVLR